ncbi:MULTISPECIES: MATE family efflux transporter [Eubacterium]|uniref:Na+-driven multidrug efflux pump n=1 Tax=Eubacterium barkeri TaxID=1528 RepID=A0A1H3HLL6_EUBBA|nr:MATE family efflux transporter [Eubacterium barkeri]SDY16352.1 Na+-driven multidrug efflux pump [Eubacterium barkeri]
MPLLNEKPKSLLFKFITASLIGALMISLYSLIDIIFISMVEGSIAGIILSRTIPLWMVINGFGYLFGIGGSILTAVAAGRGDDYEANQYFMVTMIAAVILSVTLWFSFNFFQDAILSFLSGGDHAVLQLMRLYTFYMRLGFPVYILFITTACFVRYDNSPYWVVLATAVASVFNICGDYFFIFVLELGIVGIGLSTTLAQIIGLIILMLHFFSSRCTIHLVTLTHFGRKLWNIIKIGAPTLISYWSLGTLVALLIIVSKAKGTLPEAYYYAIPISSFIWNVLTVMRSYAFAIGRAATPLLAKNYGAGFAPRVSALNRRTIAICFVICGIVATTLCFFPSEITLLFIQSTYPEMDAIIPVIFRQFSLAFIFAFYNIYVIYYYQCVLRPGKALLISLLQGIILPGLCVTLLPRLFGMYALSYSIPISEFLVALIITAFLVLDYRRTSLVPDSISKA